MTLTSCLPHEDSLEREEWQHGAFGLSLVEAFSDTQIFPSRRYGVVDGKGEPTQKNGFLELSEIKHYVVYRVKALTDGRQHAVAYPKSIPRQLDLPIADVMQPVGESE